MKRWWKYWNEPKSFKDFIYRLIRPLFVEDIDANEDFYCCSCGKPVLRRKVGCSKKCYKKLQRMGVI